MEKGQRPRSGTAGAHDLSRPGKEVLAAAALQGLIFGLVRAAVDRASAHGYRAVAHEDPR